MFRAVMWIGLAALATCLLVCISSTCAQEAADEGWIALFNGKDLTGWKATGGATWSVEDGILVGVQGEGGKAGDLYTEKDYDNFELRCTFKMVWPGNSGIWFRSKPEEKKLGYQMDILSLAEYGVTVGTIYSGGFLLKNTDESIVKLDDWNDAVVIADGKRLGVVLNGHKIGEVEDDKYSSGKVGIQVHAGDKYKNMKIMIKELKLRPLPAN